MNGYKISAIVLLSIFSFVGYLQMVNSFYGQTADKNSELEKIISPEAIVEAFWLKSEEGNLPEASSYRTNVAGNLEIVATNSPTWEEVIFSSKMNLVSSKLLKVDKQEAIVEVTAKDKHGMTKYFYHTVLKEEESWKIFAIYF